MGVEGWPAERSICVLEGGRGRKVSSRRVWPTPERLYRGEEKGGEGNDGRGRGEGRGKNGKERKAE